MICNSVSIGSSPSWSPRRFRQNCARANRRAAEARLDKFIRMMKRRLGAAEGMFKKGKNRNNKLMMAKGNEGEN